MAILYSRKLSFCSADIPINEMYSPYLLNSFKQLSPTKPFITLCFEIDGLVFKNTETPMDMKFLIV